LAAEKSALSAYSTYMTKAATFCWIILIFHWRNMLDEVSFS